MIRLAHADETRLLAVAAVRAVDDVGGGEERDAVERRERGADRRAVGLGAARACDEDSESG